MLLTAQRLLGLHFAVTLGGVALGVLSCSRSPLRQLEIDEDEVSYVCQTDADCRSANACERYACSSGLCQLVSKTTCDDANPCTDDLCNPKDGSCSFTRRTSDDDGDGYRAALPGKTPGVPDACGDDCNDASALAYPGAYEICDGVDNDCNGIIDDTQRYYSPNEGLPPVHWVSYTAKHESMPASLTYDGDKFAMTLVERNERWQGVFHALGADGTVEVPPTSLTSAANDSVAGPLLWTGSVFGTAWEDRREKSYDIYFNRLDALGKKLHPDLRVTSSLGFSIQPSLVYDGIEWLLAFADDQNTGSFTIYTQRISKDAELVGLPVAITPPAIDARQPRLSKNSDGLGLFYYSITDKRYIYQRLSADLEPNGASTPIDGGEPSDTSIRWNGDRYVLAWGTKTLDTVGNAIWGMSVDVKGNVLSPARPITWGARIARSPTIVALGDRFVLIWVDDRFSPGLFELSVQMFDNGLTAIDGQQQITSLGTDSVDPVGVLGGGALGILFRSRQRGPWHTYFTVLRCWEMTLQ